MDKRYTTEYFIERANEKHNHTYIYDKVMYTGVYDKVEIECKIHGSFLQTPKKHLVGQGCPECGVKCTKTYKTFIERAILKHGDLYDYSQIKENPKNLDLISIKCKIHGNFNQIVKNHLSGNGCPECGILKNSSARTKSTEQFINDAIIVHGSRYDYSVSQYTGIYDDIKVVCEKHGIFSQTAHVHLNGSGCPRCCKSGYKSNMKGYIYIHKVCDGIYKLGITNFPERRIEQINSKSLFNHEYIKLYSNENGKIISKLEQFIFKSIPHGIVDKGVMKDGFTETFSGDYLSTVLEIINSHNLTEELI